MKQNCVTGERFGEAMVPVPLLETTWQTAKNIINEPLVMTTETGYGKDYTTNPYEAYLNAENSLSYPVDYRDDRLPLKDRVFGIHIDGAARVYRFSEFSN